jgi:hypothetical protein
MATTRQGIVIGDSFEVSHRQLALNLAHQLEANGGGNEVESVVQKAAVLYSWLIGELDDSE